MAKDKVELEIDPVLSPGAEEKLKSTFSGIFSKGMSAAKVVGGAALGLPGAVAGAATAPIGMAKGLDVALGAFVNAFNPAVMQQFELAISDSVAVLGEALVPVVENLVPLIRTWGDFLAAVMPSQKEMNDLMKAFAPLMETVQDFLVAIAPIIKGGLAMGLVAYGEAIMALVPIIINASKQLADAFAFMIGMIYDYSKGAVGNLDMIIALRKFALSDVGAMGKLPGGSVGKSAGGASAMGFESLSEKLVMASLGMGSGNPQLEEAKKANVQLEQINGKVDEVIKAAQAAGGAAHLFNGGGKN